MLNYEEELKKFKPALDVDEVENMVYGSDIMDVIDLFREMQESSSEDESRRASR